MIIKYFLAFISYIIITLSVSEASVSEVSAVARFRLNNTVGLVRLSQEKVLEEEAQLGDEAQLADEEGVRVTGEISGLDVGQYALLLVTLPDLGCEAVSEASVMAEVYSWDQGSGETVAINNWLAQSGLLPQPGSEQQAGLLLRSCAILETGADCQQGDILQCAELTQPARPLSWHILVVIALAVFLLVCVLICIPLICYCVKRSRRKSSEDDLEDEYEDRSKSPMYDELSLPFIDASLPPTPKVGRIVNGLDILLGHSVSENSLVDKKSQVQW